MLDMSLLVQHAYGKSDKIERGIEDGNISGVILSPKSEMPQNLETYIKNVNDNIEVLLDPQFYLCAFEGDINIGKLDKYSFYPNSIINKKVLSMPKNIHKIVEDNVVYQRYCGLKTIVSPNIFFDSFDSRMSQIALSLANETIEYCNNEDVLISLCVNEAAFKNFDDVKDFLDIISLFDVSGFYVIIERNLNKNPSLIDSETMSNILYFLYNLSTINMYKVILGYGDYIGIPLYVTGIEAIATGWYENSRRFDRENFYPKDGMRRPNKRYYTNQLFNSLLLLPEIQMIQAQNMLGKILSNTHYDSYMYNDLSGGQWTESISCLSRWEAIKQIIDAIDYEENVIDKIDYMRDKIFNAISIYKKLPEEIFDSKSKSTHLSSWDEGLEKFRELLKGM